MSMVVLGDIGDTGGIIFIFFILIWLQFSVELVLTEELCINIDFLLALLFFFFKHSSNPMKQSSHCNIFSIFSHCPEEEKKLFFQRNGKIF